MISVFHDNYPAVFQAHLDNGTLSSSVYFSSTQYTSVQSPLIRQFGSSDSEAIIYFPISNGYVALIWSTTSGVPIKTYEDTSGTSATAIAESVKDGMMYVASGSLSPLSLYKFYYNNTAQRSAVLDGTASFTISSNFDYGVSSFISLLYSLSVSRIDNTTAQESVINYNEIGRATHDIFSTDENRVIQVRSAYNGTVSFNYFCSLSGASVSTGIYDPTGSSNVTSWISTNTDFATLTVNTPNNTVETNYTFGIYYSTSTENITAEYIIIVYQ